ncbi:uncharacterized protein H6S33_004051 [Morchella sextelata]|uniref:uncharacterized protein n=1 Tax=Morchella sextelata TaxID=1174677 RepID=UPI001D04D2F0|nr:uncharacterized protein H6S33_004051 [Morchella sextelata]KAH0606390.1 hypothetical protein H6S33_004051 [Morchella sextelata]
MRELKAWDYSLAHDVKTSTSNIQASIALSVIIPTQLSLLNSISRSTPRFKLPRSSYITPASIQNSDCNLHPTNRYLNLPACNNAPGLAYGDGREKWPRVRPINNSGTLRFAYVDVTRCHYEPKRDNAGIMICYEGLMRLWGSVPSDPALLSLIALLCL